MARVVGWWGWVWWVGGRARWFGGRVDCGSGLGVRGRGLGNQLAPKAKTPPTGSSRVTKPSRAERWQRPQLKPPCSPPTTLRPMPESPPVMRHFLSWRFQAVLIGGLVFGGGWCFLGGVVFGGEEAKGREEEFIPLPRRARSADGRLWTAQPRPAPRPMRPRSFGGPKAGTPRTPRPPLRPRRIGSGRRDEGRGAGRGARP